MAHQSVVAPAVAQKNYQTNVQASAGKWADGIKQYNGTSPMELAAGQVAKATANYTAVLANTGPEGWVAKLLATPVSYWKSQSAAGQQKYAMAKGATAWARWYSGPGIQIAMAMQQSAASGRQAGTGGIQRCMDALRVAESMGRKQVA